MTEEEKPLTREDVLKLIEEHGGPEGLDLSGRNLRGIDLSSHRDEPPLDLHGIILEEANLWDAHLEGAYLVGAHLEGATLWDAHLERANLGGVHLEGAFLQAAHLEGADLSAAHLEGANFFDAHLEGAFLWEGHLERVILREAHLEGANFFDAHLEGADLIGAHLEGAGLWAATFSPGTMFEDTDWGAKYILGEEVGKDFEPATYVYRTLKQWHTNAGMYDIAGKFFYREMEAKRKARSWREEPHLKLWSWAMRLLCGYGEKPLWLVGWGFVVIFGLAGFYTGLGSFASKSFLNCLYYSAASFTALGYGSWAPQPSGWAKGMGAAEAVIGVFIMALFLVTFVRKMVR